MNGTVNASAPSKMSEVAVERLSNDKAFKVIFVLGGPGSGKGTQCAKIAKHFGFTHLSAGDLLRAEINSGSKNGTMIESMINEGKIVPSEVTIKLLQRAMHESGNDKFLIDGFPRNEENRAAFENLIDACKPADEVFEDVKAIFSRFRAKEDSSQQTNISTVKRFELVMCLMKRLFREIKRMWSCFFCKASAGLENY